MQKHKFHIICMMILLAILITSSINNLSSKHVVHTFDSKNPIALHKDDTGSNFSIPLYSINNASTSSNDVSDFSVNTFGFTVLSTTLNFSNLVSSGISLDVEVDYQALYKETNCTLYMSFTVPSTAYLKNFSAFLYINSGENVTWAIYNSTWDASFGSKPDIKIDNGGYILSTSTDPQWYSVTGLNILLNTSITHNSTFFIEINSTYAEQWYYVNDDSTGDNDDEGYAWYIYKGSLLFYQVDFRLRDIGLEPYNTNPSPPEVSMKVNGTNVNADGIWTSTTSFSSPSIYYDVTTIWPTSYQVVWQLNSTKTLVGETTYLVEGDIVKWNVSVDTTLPSHFITTNFTHEHPTDWTLRNVYNYTTSYSNYLNSTSFTKVYWDRGNGSWILSYDSPNYLSSTSIDPYPNATLVDNISIVAIFTSGVVPTSNSGTLEIYNSSSYKVYNDTALPQNGMLNFSWIPSQNVSVAGNYSIKILWTNGTEVGYVESSINVLYNTSLSSLFDSNQLYLIGENLLVTVYYKNEFNNENITSAKVVGSWAYNSNVIFEDIGNGQYRAIINTSQATAGNFTLSVYASKSWYEPQTINITISLIYNTTIEGNTAYNTNYTIPVNISVKYSYTNGTGITGATAKIYINGSEKSMNDNGNGNYSYKFLATDVGVFNCTITTNKTDHLSQKLTVWVYVYELTTDLSCQSSYQTNYTISVTITVNYTLTNGTGITNAPLRIYVNGTENVMTEDGNGNYSYLFSADQTGTFNCTVLANKTGHETQIFTIWVYVYNLTTDLTGKSLYQTNYSLPLSIVVNYTLANGSGIEGATVRIYVNGTENAMTEDGNGNYSYSFPTTTIGVFNCTIVADKTGHETQIFTTWVYVYELSTNLSAPSSYSVKYNDYLIFEANFTMVNGTGVDNAVLILTVGSYNYTMDYNGSGQYTKNVLINFTGVNSYTIYAEKYGFVSKTYTGSLTIIMRLTNISAAAPNEVYAGSSLNVSFTYLDNETGDGIPNATWTLHFYGNVSNIDYSVLNQQNGTYTVMMNVTNPSSSNITVTVEMFLSSVGFEDAIMNASFVVVLKSLTFSSSYNNEIDYGSNWSILVNYGVDGAQVLINWSEYWYQDFGNGSYYITLNTTTVDPGNHIVNITIKKENYVWYTQIISFEINDIPTELVIIGDTQIAWGGTLKLTVFLKDTYHNKKVSDWILQTNETIDYSFNGTDYILVFNSTIFDIGEYTILINGDKSLYQSQQTFVLVRVNPGILDASYNYENYCFVNETIPFVLLLNNSLNGMFVSGATVKLTVFNETYDLVEIDNGVYAVNITLPSVSGAYTGSIDVSASKYADKSFSVKFYVLNKYETKLTLNFVSQAEEGSQIVLNATLTYSNGTPVVGVPITFQINVTYKNGTSIIENRTVLTNNYGSAIYTYEVPENAERLSVTVVYEGGRATLPSSKSAVITVKPRMTLQNVLFQFAPILIIAGVALSAGVLVRKKQKKKKVARLMELQATRSIYDDLLNIRHLFVIHANFGVNLFYRAYGVAPLEPELISGFLTALSQFAQEVSDVEEEITEHKYKGMSILMIRHGLIRVAFISSKELSDAFKVASSKVVVEIGKKYQQLLEEWTGNLKEAEVVGFDIEKKLALPLFYVPLAIDTCEKIKKRGLKRICNQIVDLKKTTNVITVKTIIDAIGKEYIDSILLLLKMGILKEAHMNNTNRNNPVDEKG